MTGPRAFYAMAAAGAAFTALADDVAGTHIDSEVARRRFAEAVHGHVAALPDDVRTALLHMALANLLVDGRVVTVEGDFYTHLLERRVKGR